MASNETDGVGAVNSNTLYTKTPETIANISENSMQLVHQSATLYKRNVFKFNVNRIYPFINL